MIEDDFGIGVGHDHGAHRRILDLLYSLRNDAHRPVILADGPVHHLHEVPHSFREHRPGFVHVEVLHVFWVATDYIQRQLGYQHGDDRFQQLVVFDSGHVEANQWVGTDVLVLVGVQHISIVTDHEGFQAGEEFGEIKRLVPADQLFAVFLFLQVLIQKVVESQLDWEP